MSVNLSALRVLIIDDMSTVRQTIRNMLTAVGLTQVVFAATVGEARKRVQTEKYDLVLCDYHMGNGANGQDFLEEIRHNGSLPLATSFFMVTSEASYERVVSIAEVAPDDYMLKPFSSRDLIERMARSTRKKLVLRPLYQAIEGDEIDRAVEVGRQIMREHELYRLDAARLLAQLFNDLGRLDEATQLYLEVVETKAVPWARLGIAGVYAKTGMKKEAAEIYKDMLDNNPNYVEVYDRLAQHYLDEGQEEKALAIMERAVAITPHNVGRLQTAGQLAFRMGKLELAQGLLKRAVVSGGNSTSFDPRVLFSLLVAACRSNSARDAQQYAAMLEHHVEKSGEASLKQLIPLSKGALAVIAGKPEAAQEIASYAINSLCEGPLDTDLAFDLFSLFSLLPPDCEPIPQWVCRVTARYAVSRQTAERLRITLREQPPWAELVMHEANKIQELANAGMNFVVTHKDFRSAARFLYKASMETRNPRLIKNAYNAAVKGIEGGADSDLSDIIAVLKPMMEELEAGLVSE